MKEALRLLATERVDRAILDFNLADGEVTPVMEVLSGKAVPMIIYTGRGLPPNLASRHPHVTVLRKPVSHKRLIAELAAVKAAIREWRSRPVPCGGNVARGDNLAAQNLRRILSTI